MDAYDALVMTVAENGGMLDSRTAIQKLCYFYTLKMAGFAPRYLPYLYGPFSKEVASALVDLSAFSFFSEYLRSCGGYTYEITESGRKYAARVSGELPGERDQIRGVLAVCKERCGLKPAPLSYAAKCHYVLRNGGAEHTVKEARDAGRDLCWDISDDDAEGGISLLKELGLVR